MDMDKTLIYLERSKSSPINLQLHRTVNLHPDDSSLSLHDPFLQVIPHAIRRLKYLSLEATPENLQEIIPHLSHPAPLLEQLLIGGGSEPQHNTMLTTTLFNGNLTSLHCLHIQSIRTQLPWRNMLNLTSFALFYPSPEEPSITQLLDFFESTPRLLDIRLHLTTSTLGAKNDRLVSLPCLKSMVIIGETPPSTLLNHLLIPAGAKLTTRATFRDSMIEDHLPSSLDNLKNLSNFTRIRLCIGGPSPYMRFIGPNGRVSIIPIVPPADTICLAVDSLGQFNTSETERLDIDYCYLSSTELPYRALLPMKNLRTLTLSRFIHQCALVALHPDLYSSKDAVCPKLEELVLVLGPDGEGFDIKGVIEIAAARASRGAKLSTVRIIVGRGKLDPRGVLELRKHVSHVEHGPDVGDSDDGDSDEDSDDSDEDSDDSDEDSDDSDEDSDDSEGGSDDSDEED